MSVEAAHPHESGSVGDVAVVVRHDRVRVADPAFTERAREEFRGRDARRVRRRRIGKLVRVVEMNRAREMPGCILLGTRRRDQVGRAMRSAARVNDSQCRVVRMRAHPIDFNKHFRHRHAAAI